MIDEKEMNRKARAALLNLGIDIDPKAKVESLSVGLSQMVEIAKAVIKDAKILVLMNRQPLCQTESQSSFFS